jgi:hypothetical protein
MKLFGTTNTPFTASNSDVLNGAPEELLRPTNQQANTFYGELQTAIESSGQTLTAATGAENVDWQLRKAILIHATRSMRLSASGSTANAKTLAPINSNTVLPSNTLLNGCVFVFNNPLANSGNVTISVFMGATPIITTASCLNLDGAQFASGEMVAGEWEIVYNFGANNFTAYKATSLLNTQTATQVTQSAAAMGANVQTALNYLQAKIGNYAGVSSYTTSATAVASDAGKFIYLAGAGGSTFTLPATVGMSDGFTITLFTNTAWTIAANSGQAIWNSTNGSGSRSSFLTTNGDNVELTFLAGNWYFSGGSAALKYTGGFASSFTSNGYQKLPSGLIIQWMSGTAGGSSTSANNIFPIAFPNALLMATGLHFGGDASTNIIADASNYTATQVGMRSNHSISSVTCLIFAIGY